MSVVGTLLVIIYHCEGEQLDRKRLEDREREIERERQTDRQAKKDRGRRHL